jgi:ribosomal protein L44E
MNIKSIGTKPVNAVELTYRCDRCEFDTTRTVKAIEK